MDGDQVIVFSPDDPGKLPCRPEIRRREHTFLEGDVPHLICIRDGVFGSPGGDVNRVPLLVEIVQIGKVKVL